MSPTLKQQSKRLIERYNSDNTLDELPVAVAAGHDRCSHGTVGPCSVRKQACERDGAGRLGHLVRGLPQGAHRLLGRLVADLDEAGCSTDHRLDGVLVGYPGGDAVDESVGFGRCDRAPGLERECVCGGTLGPNSDDLGAAAEQVAYSDVGAKPGALADRHVDHVEVGGLLVQLGGVGRDADDQVTVERRHQMQTVLLGEPNRVLPRLLEVAPTHDQPGAESLNRGVLVRAVAFGDDDRDRYAVRASGVGQRLAVVAARGGDHAAHRAFGVKQPRNVDQSAAHLEGAGRSGVLVLDPGRCAGNLLQQRPAVRRRHRHMRPHDSQGGVEFGALDHGMSLNTFARRYVYAGVESVEPKVPPALWMTNRLAGFRPLAHQSVQTQRGARTRFHHSESPTATATSNPPAPANHDAMSTCFLTTVSWLGRSPSARCSWSALSAL